MNLHSPPEKNPMPTINVNLRTCDCGARPDLHPGFGTHLSACPAQPVIIPCPILRSATFKVRLGECRCKRLSFNYLRSATGHKPMCPGDLIRVTCSISGDTWADSQVGDMEPTNCDTIRWTWAEGTQIGNACYERWAFIKALVLGKSMQEYSGYLSSQPQALSSFFAQRDAVCAALVAKALSEAEEHRADVALFHALKRADHEGLSVAGPASYAMAFAGDPANPEAELNSRAGLAAYVELLLEQVEKMG